MDERPAPSPEKLLNQFREWIAGDELPGRTMSNLKTGFLPEVLAEQDPAPAAAVVDAWAEWEAGTTNPTAVLETLRANGLEDLLAGLAGQ